MMEEDEAISFIQCALLDGVAIVLTPQRTIKARGEPCKVWDYMEVIDAHFDVFKDALEKHQKVRSRELDCVYGLLDPKRIELARERMCYDSFRNYLPLYR